MANKDTDFIGMLIAGGIGLLAIIFGKNLFGGGGHSNPSSSNNHPPSLPPTLPNISAYNATKSDCGCGL